MVRLTLDITQEQLDILERALTSYGVKYAELRDDSLVPSLASEYDQRVQIAADVMALVRSGALADA